jgi:hypothetical protein
MDTPEPAKPALHRNYDSAELGALAHLYRGEVYRSTIWRTRLDNTTNWSVALLGIALGDVSTANASPPAAARRCAVSVSAVPGATLSLLNVWRAAAWLETHSTRRCCAASGGPGQPARHPPTTTPRAAHHQPWPCGWPPLAPTYG